METICFVDRPAHLSRLDVRYKNFLRDVLNFKRLLESLNVSLNNAKKKYDRTGFSAYHADAIYPFSTESESERKAIVGNFKATLEDCDKLLEQRKALLVKHSKVFDNLQYHLSQQEQRITELRKRLRFHTDKIFLVISRLSIDLLRIVDTKVDDLLGMAEEHQVELVKMNLELRRLNSLFVGEEASVAAVADNAHLASAFIARRFEENLIMNAPVDVHEGIPLAEGFDAMYSAFQESKQGQDQTPEKYLFFLKARWLVGRIKQGREYETARSGFYYRRVLHQIEQSIMGTVRTPGALISFEDSVLLDLPPGLFLIWQPVSDPIVPELPPHPSMIHADEEEVARIPIAPTGAGDEGTLVVFKRSEGQFRTVSETVLASRPTEKVVIPQLVHTREDGLIPRYALPTLESPPLELCLFSRGMEQMYNFTSLHELYNLQAALTGFEVSHYQSVFGCQIEGFKELDCSGRVQLWQKPVAPADTKEQRNGDNRPPTTKSSSARSASGYSRTESILSSLTYASSVHRVSGGLESAVVKSAALVIFAELRRQASERQLAIIFVELGPGVEIDQTHKNKEGKSLAIKMKKDKLKVQYRYCESNNGKPNTNTFDIFPFCTANTCNPVQTRLARHLLLDFDTPRDMELFCEELKIRFLVRDKQLKDREDIRVGVQDDSRQRDRNGGPSASRNPSTRSTMSASPSQQCLPSNLINSGTSPTDGLAADFTSAWPQRALSHDSAASAAASSQHSGLDTNLQEGPSSIPGRRSTTVAGTDRSERQVSDGRQTPTGLAISTQTPPIASSSRHPHTAISPGATNQHYNNYTASSSSAPWHLIDPPSPTITLFHDVPDTMHRSASASVSTEANGAGARTSSRKSDREHGKAKRFFKGVGRVATMM